MEVQCWSVVATGEPRSGFPAAPRGDPSVQFDAGGPLLASSKEGGAMMSGGWPAQDGTAGVVVPAVAVREAGLAACSAARWAAPCGNLLLEAAKGEGAVLSAG